MANKWTNNGVNCLSLSDEIGSNLPKYPKEKERESGGGGGGFSARDGMGWEISRVCRKSQEKLGTVWVFVQLIFGLCLPNNQPKHCQTRDFYSGSGNLGGGRILPLLSSFSAALCCITRS